MNINYQRKSSKGRSDYIETSIFILESLFKENSNLNEIQILINNRTLPSELRTIAWKIFLKILPSNNSTPKDWVIRTMKHREEYEKKYNKINNLDIIENIINNKTTIEEVSKCSSEQEKAFIQSKEFELFKYSYEFLSDNMSQIYDLFKNEVIIESFIKIYLTYVLNNDIKDFSHAPFLHILSAIIYSLFPSIIHQFSDNSCDLIEKYNKKSLENNEILMKDLFNFLNSEAYFDHDVYIIFETILEEFKHKELIFNLNNQSKLTVDLNEIENLDPTNITIVDLIAIMIKVQKCELSDYMAKYKLNISTIFKFWISTFFASTFSLDDVTYLIDAVLANESQLPNEEVNLWFINPNIKFHFIYFLFASLLCLGSDHLMKTEKITELQEFNNHLLIGGLKIRDFKQVLNKALANRVAMSLLYMKHNK